MANEKNREAIINQLEDSISDDVGNMHEDNLEEISSQFNRILDDALKNFNSRTFDNDGFIEKLKDLDVGSKDKNLVKNVLNNIKVDYLSADSINQSEILLKRDIKNICTQMPEMRDVINLTRDGIIECNVSTGEVSRSLVFENHEDDESYTTQAKEVEKHHNLLMANKNFIVPNTLMNGELYVHCIPFAKLFAEIELINSTKGNNKYINNKSVFRESIPNDVLESLDKSNNKTLENDKNVKLLLESMAPITSEDSSIEYKIADPSANEKKTKETIASDTIKSLLGKIEINNASSILMTELGEEGFEDFIFKEYTENRKKAYENRDINDNDNTVEDSHFMEAMGMGKLPGGGMFNSIDQDDIDITDYKHIKGCYIKYLDPLRTIPIRIDRKVIGYYYVTTTMDLQNNPAQPNGMIDLSYQQYTRDRNMVDQLANIIIKSFDKKMLDKNIKLKNEIAEIIMAHKFAEGKLNFIYIPENEIIRFVINEDENGKGHSMLEPSLFPARNYLMLNMYNMLYTLNNNTTRIHYLMSSGLNKDYAAQIQRTMRKFQSRRITIDDIYSYQGVLNKIGGMGEMVLPAGRGNNRALETDTIEAVNNPISVEFLEQQRRQALSGTGAPHLLVINAIDEVDFAKTLEMANARFLSTVSSYKIDFNKGFTNLYQHILRYETDMEEEIISSFRFQYNAAKQQELNITSDMIQNFNALVEVVISIFYNKNDMEDEKGNPTPKQIHLRKELAKEYLPQLNIDELEKIVNKVNIDSTDDQLQAKVSDLTIEKEDIDKISKE